LVCATMVGFALKPINPPPAPPIDVSALNQEVRKSDPQAGPRQESLSAEIASALSATDWPVLEPTMEEVISQPDVTADVMACRGPALVDRAACTWGEPDATKTAVVVGDSISVTYQGVLKEIVEKSSSAWEILGYGSIGCTFTSVLIANADRGLQDACEARKADAVRVIKEIQPDVVFVSNVYLPRTPVGADDPLTAEQYEDSSFRLIAELRPHAKKIVFLAPPPANVDPADCYTPRSNPADCISDVTTDWLTGADIDQAVARRVRGATWVDSRPWFCVLNKCPAFVDGVPTKRDQVHMSPAYQKLIAPTVNEYLRREGIF
jgi:hypothetical protein